MVAPITLNVRHIKGYTFTVEVDHDADALGLKVIIWELQHIPVDKQRLVFGGKELTEGIKLSDMGVTDGGQIFLIESGFEDGVAAASNDNGVTAAVVPPAFSPEAGQAEAVASQSGSFMVSVPQPDSRYELVSDNDASNERVSAALALAKYVRVYCIFGFIVSVLSLFDCMWSAIPVLFYLFGWIGTRKLNRCLIAFPMIIALIVGFLGTGNLIYLGIVADYWPSGFWVTLYVVMLLIGIFHIMIFFSITKLMCRIGKLSRDEWCTARAKIISRGCCC